VKEKSPAVQWYPKQYLGDDKVLAMDWDARGMHHWLLNLSWQQEPVGSIPDDICLVRRWLGLPSGSADADRVWARVWPQIKAAWALKDGRWFNAGMVRAWERQQTYKQNGSKNGGKRKLSLEDEEIRIIKAESKEKRIDELVSEVLSGIGIPGNNPMLETAVASAIEAKAGEPNWTQAKAALHMIERGNAYKSSAQFHSRFKRKWADWFHEQMYDQNPSAWNDGEHVTDSGQKIDRGYIPLKKT